jgi:hypothetical protein
MYSAKRYFDIFAEYAKYTRTFLSASRHGTGGKRRPYLPDNWCRNTVLGNRFWRPIIAGRPGRWNLSAELQHWQYGKRWLQHSQPNLFTKNERTRRAVHRNRSPYVKDAFHEYVIRQNRSAVNPDQIGTKMAAHYVLDLGPGHSATLKLRLTDLEPLGGMDTNATVVGTISSPGHQERSAEVPGTNDFGAGFDGLFELRKTEADEFYASRISQQLSDDAKNVMRQAWRHAGNQAVLSLRRDNVAEGDPAGRLRPKNGCTEETRIDASTTTTSFPCRTNGNTLGTPHGIWHSTAFLLPSSILILRKNN